MSKTLIYLFAVFGLWLYFKYGNFTKKPEEPEKGEESKKTNLNQYDFRILEEKFPKFMRPGEMEVKTYG